MEGTAAIANEKSPPRLVYTRTVVGVLGTAQLIPEPASSFIL